MKQALLDFLLGVIPCGLVYSFGASYLHTIVGFNVVLSIVLAGGVGLLMGLCGTHLASGFARRFHA